MSEILSVVVETMGEPRANEAIAEASAYLAYGDQSDTYGTLRDIQSVSTEVIDGDMYVTIIFTADIDGEDLKRFMSAMVDLAHVVSVEKLANAKA